MKEIPQEHQDLVFARVKEAREHPESMLDWDKISNQLDVKNKGFDAKKFNGALKFDEDALTIQKAV